MRIALGYDSHRLGEGQGLMLGGVFLPGPVAVEGAHSDGDVLLHAVADALLSPLGTDIGVMFSNEAPQWKGADSSFFVREAFAAFSAEGWFVHNMDMVIIADCPKIAPHSTFIKEHIASLLELNSSQLGLRGKTSEGSQPWLVQAYCSALFGKK